MQSNEWILELKNISKSFGTNKANKDIHLKVRKGDIHALIGENGAGKSTLVKIIFGLYQADSGELIFKNRSTVWKNSAEAMKSGIGMVHQHFMLGEPFTALDNLILHDTHLKLNIFAPIPRESLKKNYIQQCNEVGFEVDFDQKISEVPVGLQQRIEILKVLQNSSDLIILDEPTAVLTPQEVKEFFITLKKLKAQGKTILIITHKLKEVMALADRATVIRQGAVAGEVEISKSSIEELASMMVGKHFDFSKSYPKYSYPEKSEPSLKIKDLIRTDAHKKTLQNISMQVFKGEVVGIAGVEGNGQSELIKTLLGIHESHENLVGSIELLNQEILHKSTEEILQQDIAYLPEDRLHQGLLLESNLVDNFFLTHHQKPTWIKNGLIQWNLIREQLQKLLIKFDVRPATSQNLAKSYSGGNQQKFVIARELSKNPKFLLATQPTRGVDIGAIQFIHDQIMDFRDKGCAVLLISSELDELLKLSDRILVLFDGKIVGEFNKENFNEFEIGKLMGGAL